MSDAENDDGANWKKVEVKKKDKKKSQSDSPKASSRLEGPTKASGFRSLIGLAPVKPVRSQEEKMADAAKRKAEREARFNTGRKVAAVPDILRPSESSSEEEETQKVAAKDVKGKTEPKKAAQGKPNEAQQRALKEALKKVDVNALKEEVTKAKAAQGNDRWVRLIPERLNEQLAKVPVDNHFYTDEGFTWGYPLDVAPDNLTKFLHDTFSKEPTKFLEAYVSWCVKDACANYIAQRKTAYGSQLVVQYLLKNWPNLVEKTLDERVADVNSYKSRQNEMLLIMWCYGQAGLTSFANGFQVWYKLMFPLLNMKGYTSFVVTYLEELFKHHKTPDFSKVEKQEVFLNVFDAFLGTNSVNYPKPVKGRLAELLDKLRELIMKKDLKSTSKEYFSTFLMRLGLQQPAEYQKAASENVLLTLKTNPALWDFWLKEKLNLHLRESSTLLEHISTSKDEYVNKLRKDSKFVKFLEQVHEFEPAKSGKKVESEVKKNFDKLRQTVQKFRDQRDAEGKKNRRTRYKYLFYLVLALIAGEIVYHGPKNSYSIRTFNVARPLVVKSWNAALPFVIRAWNVLIKPFLLWAGAFSIQLLQIVWVYAVQLWGYIEAHLPAAYDFMVDMVGRLDWLWRYLSALGYQLLHKMDGLLQNAPSMSQILQKISPIVQFIGHQISNLYTLIEPYFYQALHAVGIGSDSKVKSA